MDLLFLLETVFMFSYLQLHQGYPWALQNQAFQVILEGQQDLSFLVDLLDQTLPLKQKQDWHKVFILTSWRVIIIIIGMSEKD